MGPADFSEMRTQKEGVFVYQELNIAAQETSENNTETFSGEDKGVMDESKIVPIVNKTNSAEDGCAAATSETAAQMVAQHAALPAESAVLQAAGQTAAPSAGSTAQSQPTAQDAVQSARQPEASSGSGANAVPTVSGNPGTDTRSRTSTDDSAAADTGDTAKTDQDSSRRSRKRRSFRFDTDDDFDFDEDERPKKRFFRSASDEASRDKMILSRIKDEDLMEYLALEQRRLEFLQQAKEAKEKRILIAFQLLISLAAIVGITYLLQDNPTILISILYIVGIVAALNVWKNPHDRWGKR